MNTSEKQEVYKCSVCGNIVEVLSVGGGELICCNQPMELQKEKTEDAGNEKHVPVIEKNENGYLVKVGSVEHPMEKDHFIQWIELIADGVIYRKHLNPGEKPEAEFCISASKVQAREFCNKHGHWKSQH